MEAEEVRVKPDDGFSVVFRDGACEPDGESFRCSVGGFFAMSTARARFQNVPVDDS